MGIGDQVLGACVALQSLILTFIVFQRARDHRAVREMDTWISAILRTLQDWSTKNSQCANGNSRPKGDGDGTDCDLTNRSSFTSDSGAPLVAKKNPRARTR